MAIKTAPYHNDGETPPIPVAGNAYNGPTPRATIVDQNPFTAPTSLPSTNEKPVPHAAFDALDG